MKSSWHSALEQVPDEVKLASRLTSAYLCERKDYFSTTKYVLYIRNEYIEGKS